MSISLLPFVFVSCQISDKIIRRESATNKKNNSLIFMIQNNKIRRRFDVDFFLNLNGDGLGNIWFDVVILSTGGILRILDSFIGKNVEGQIMRFELLIDDIFTLDVATEIVALGDEYQ